MSRRALTMATLIGLALAPATALASWSQGGGGSAYVKATALAAVAQPSASVANRSVTVNWTPAVGGAPPSGYLVKRYDGAGTVQAIGSACSGTIASTSCTENAVPPGSWRYRVTPANANWRGAESPPSAAVTVSSPALTLDSPTTPSPGSLGGQITNFISGQTVSFRLDNPTTGTVLSGSITPSPVPGSGTATVGVTVPAGTSAGAHTIYAIGGQGDVAGAGVTVLISQSVSTTAWDLRDASAGSAEVNASDPIAFGADGRTVTTTAPLLLFATTSYLQVDYSKPLPSNATPSSSSFDFRFAAASALNTACFYFDVRLASTDAVLATHGGTGSPVGCVTGTTQTSFSTPLPEVTTRAIANDLRVRVYIRDSLLTGPAVDQATISTTTTQGAFTLYDEVFTDRVNTGTTDRTWPLAANGGPTYTSASTWSTSFAAGRYLRLIFPTYVPSGATMTGASFTHRYRAGGSGTVCWYFEVLQGATVIGTHGSAGSPISCNSSASTYQEDTIDLPEISSVPRANGAVIKVYMRNSASQTSQTDWARLQLQYAN